MLFQDQTHLFIGSNFLGSTLEFPILFIATKGGEKQLEDNSFYNDTEINNVIHLIEQLLQTKAKDNHGQFTRDVFLSDIGVVSPYRKQCNELIKHLSRKKINNIDVGSAEVFQGQQRLVMIVSTVRSNKDRNLGFVANAKVCVLQFIPIFQFNLNEFSNLFSFLFQRLNVMLTRAIGLLIIVGDPITLGTDENWRNVIEYIFTNGGYFSENEN